LNSIQWHEVRISDRVIGKGEFATVYSACARGLDLLCVKILNNQPLTVVSRFHFMKGVRDSLRLNHPALIRVFSHTITPVYAVLMEMEHFTLDKIISFIHGVFPPLTPLYKMYLWDDTNSAILVYGIAAALCHMHEKRIVHGGLRPDNIMVDKNLRPQVCPFSISQYSRPHNFIFDFFNGKNPRNWIYIAPEQILGWNENPAIDVYSFAIIAYEIATRHHIEENLPKGFSGLDILKGKRPPIPNSMNGNWRMLIERCWNMNPDDRPTFREIIDQCGGQYFWTTDSRQYLFDDYEQMIINGFQYPPDQTLPEPDFRVEEFDRERVDVKVLKEILGSLSLNEITLADYGIGINLMTVIPPGLNEHLQHIISQFDRKKLETAGLPGSNTDLVFDLWELKPLTSAVNTETPVAPLVTSSRQPKQVSWSWNANPDPFSPEDAMWRAYPQEIVEKLEVAYEKFMSEGKPDYYDIPQYRIIFGQWMQISLADSRNIRQVQRAEGDMKFEGGKSRFVGDIAVQSSLRTLLWNQILGSNVFDYLTVNDEPLSRLMLQKDRRNELVDAAIRGITDLCVSENWMREGRQFDKRLKTARAAGFEAVLDTVIELYTEETFLYKTMNSQLRGFACGKSDRQLEFLGPYIGLLDLALHRRPWDTSRDSVLYRGARLRIEEVEFYRSIDIRFKLDAVTSTTRNFEIALKFSRNAIFRFTGCSARGVH
jgi:serine/threonine protein kinase